MIKINFSNIKIDKICSVFELQRLKGDGRKTLSRSNSAIVIIEYGKISYYQDDDEFVQTTDVAIILPKGATYSLYCHEEALCYIINFDEETNLIRNEILTVELALKNSMIEKAKKMCHYCNMRSTSYELKLMSLMYGVLADINTSMLMDNKQRKYYEIIKPSINFMEEHYYDCGIKNDDLARISNISTVYFRKIFTRLYGISPIHYLEIRKIEKAKELLNSDELTVTEIAVASGFKDIYHFCRAFKKITGFSPNNYRKKILS